MNVAYEQTLERLCRLANDSLRLWDLQEGAKARLINVSENATYLVEEPSGGKSVLRVHREGYHSRRAIECELAWTRALRQEGGVFAPLPIAGRNGEEIQSGSMSGLAQPRHMVLFEFVEGVEPDESQDLRGPFKQLGEICARTHLHSMSWKRGEEFERLVWDEEHIFHPYIIWGDWREAPCVGAREREILECQEKTLRRRLAVYGKNADVFGLIHADMRLANLLIYDNAPRLIDFDDCGLGWYLYDFAAGISFMEDHPDIPDLLSCWLEGYESVRPLRTVDKDEIESFVMLRRMALLAWIGSHKETDLAKEMAPHFAKVTTKLAESYLLRFET